MRVLCLFGPQVTHHAVHCAETASVLALQTGDRLEAWSANGGSVAKARRGQHTAGAMLADAASHSVPP